MRRVPALLLGLPVLLAACAGPANRGDVAPDPVPVAVAPEAPAARTDSLRPLSPVAALLAPVARIADDRIDESSGLAYAGGAWWTLNDSGGGPFVYRSDTPWFTTSERCEVPGATNVDWEELAVLDGDLLVCDVGDNSRKRDDCVLYRVRPTASGVDLVATYPVAYPDGPHDAEGVWVFDGRVHVVLKNRGEETTSIYRFDSLLAADELPEGARNVATVVGDVLLREGEQVTSADVDADGHLALLTYGQLLVYDAAALHDAPLAEFQLHARQCEAVAWTGDGVVFTNEQRDVYHVQDPLACGLAWWMPPRAWMPLRNVPRTTEALRASLPPLELLPAMPLRNRRLGEHVGVALSGDLLVIDGRFLVEGDLVPAEGRRPGTGLLIGIGSEPRIRVTAAERQFAVTATKTGTIRVLPIDLSGGEPQGGLAGVSYGGHAASDEFVFYVAIETRVLFPDGVPDQILLGLFGNGLREGDDEPLFSGLDAYSLLRPYTWGVLRR